MKAIMRQKCCENGLKMATVNNPIVTKGAPAQESRTSTRLVSPAAGWKKKKDASRTSSQNLNLSTFDYLKIVLQVVLY